jgi:hypothetical protein
MSPTSKTIAFLVSYILFHRLVLCVSSSPATSEQPSLPAPLLDPLPRMWIFVGLPGDVSHQELFSQITDRLTKVMNQRYGVNRKDITVLYDKSVDNSYLTNNYETMAKELERICTYSVENRPLWIFFLGHSNSKAGNVNFNLPGKDISSRTIGSYLSKADKDSKMVLFQTTSASGKFLKQLATPGRIIISATDVNTPDNETEYPLALVEVLEDPKSDLNQDGYLSVFEIFCETKRKVEAVYEKDNLFQDEHALLDGNGDGRGTGLPSERDALPTQNMKLHIKNLAIDEGCSPSLVLRAPNTP